LVTDKENTANAQLHGSQPAAARCVPPLQSNNHYTLNMPLRIWQCHVMTSRHAFDSKQIFALMDPLDFLHILTYRSTP
jgi:hypothetical protein